MKFILNENSYDGYKSVRDEHVVVDGVVNDIDFIDITEYIGAPAGKAALLYDGNLIEHMFDEESNNYKKSEIYRYLQSGEFAREAGIKIDYDSIDLLSTKQVERLPENIRKYKDWWWLRSHGRSSVSAALVNRGGFVYCSGDYVDYSDYAVRPALVVDEEEYDKLVNA